MMPALLDFRLMVARQPLTALLLGGIIACALWLAMQPSEMDARPGAGGVDPARIVAAQRNFQAILIPPSGLAKAQQTLLESASGHQLNVGHVEYAQETEADPGFVRASMSFPVTGRYADIRAFIEGALARQPALLIRRVTIQNDGSGEDSQLLKASLSVKFLIGRSCHESDLAPHPSRTRFARVFRGRQSRRRQQCVSFFGRRAGWAGHSGPETQFRR